MSNPTFLDSPLFQMGLMAVRKLDVRARTAMVEQLCTLLEVKIGFWDASAEPPRGVPLVVELEPGKYAIASRAPEGQDTWLAYPAGTPLKLSPQRWAVIPL